jgi:hypothetical protein
VTNRRFIKRLCLSAAVVLLAGSAGAFELRQLEIVTRRGAYEIDMAFHVRADTSRIIDTLTDYDRPRRLNPDVDEMQVLHEQDGVTRVRTTFKACALVLCRDLSMVQDVTVVPDRVTAKIIPTAGDFRAGQYDWHVTEAVDGGADVRFRATVEYEFFVMPIIGKLILRKRLREQLLITAENLEIAASR